MAFIISSGNVISFAEYDDVVEIDSRVFDANEGLTEAIVEDMLTRSTDRLMSKLKASDWWRIYNNVAISGTLGVGITIPTPNKNKIMRQTDWTELCVYHTLANYIYPKIGDFTEGSVDERKIALYQEKFNALWDELMSLGDFYDSDDDGTVEEEEKLLRPIVRRRSRGYTPLARVK